MTVQLYERKNLKVSFRLDAVRFEHDHMLSDNQITEFYGQPQVKNELIN